MLNVNQIQSRLKTLPQPALFQAGVDNQHDIIMFGLINSENDRRQQIKQQAMSMQAGQQPPVNQQDLSKMAPSSAPNMGAGIPLQGPGSAAQMMPPTSTAAGLPESTGIGALPAPNLKRMADGGITGFAEGGLDSYAPQIFAEAKRLGIDPIVAFNLFKTESAGNKHATSGKGAAGLGQLMKPAAKEMGLSDEDRYDPQKNIPASLGYFKKQLDRFGSYDKAAAAYNWGPGHVQKHLEKNNGVLDRLSLPKETASYLTKLMPGKQANAAEIPQAAAPTQAPVSSASMIPGQSVQAPAYVAPQKGFFGNMADKLGISENAQMNLGNLANAAAGATGATFIPSYLPKVGLGIAGLGERLYNKFAPEAGAVGQKGVAELQAANKAAQVEKGLQGAQEAGSTLEEQDYIRKMMEANQQAQLPSKALELQNAADIRRATEAARVLEGANAARATTTGTAGIADLSNAAAQPRQPMPPMQSTTPNYNATTEAEDQSFGPSLQGTKQTPATSDIAKTVTDTAGGKGGRDWNDFLLNLGLGMMAGTSPYALQNIGTAGIGALKQEQEAKMQGLKEREVAAQERRAASEEALGKQHGAYFAANAKYLEDQRGPMGALSIAQKDYAQWVKDNFGATPEQQAAAYKGFVDSAFRNTGIINPGMMTPERQASFAQYGTK